MATWSQHARLNSHWAILLLNRFESGFSVDAPLVTVCTRLHPEITCRHCSKFNVAPFVNMNIAKQQYSKFIGPFLPQRSWNILFGGKHIINTFIGHLQMSCHQSLFESHCKDEQSYVNILEEYTFTYNVRPHNQYCAFLFTLWSLPHSIASTSTHTFYMHIPCIILHAHPPCKFNTHPYPALFCHARIPCLILHKHVPHTCTTYYSISTNIIVASLSEPHTDQTASPVIYIYMFVYIVHHSIPHVLIHWTAAMCH